MNFQTLAARAARWLEHDPDPKTRRELKAMMDAQDPRLAQTFAGRVRFGTAGLRAEVGCGPTRLNALVVRQTVAGVCAVLKTAGLSGHPVAIGFDGRLDSEDWAAHAVGVLRAFGHSVALFDAPVPTPLVGFWVKENSLAAGIVITASHNPPKDNGIKVYWTGGAQIAPPVDSTIAKAIEQVAAEDHPVAYLSPSAPGPAVERPRLQAQQLYCERLHACLGDSSRATLPIRLAYTPLHGVGSALVHQALVDAPIDAIVTVASQQQPDGHFPTIASPNPEDHASLKELLALARDQRCDIACANDPDADRLAVAVRDASGDYVMLTGDEIGTLLAHALLSRAFDPKHCALASSCVSSRLLSTICRKFGARHSTTLPGFKWLAQAMQAAAQANKTPLLAYEEALGFMPTTLAWDKDGVSTLYLITRLAAEQRSLGATLLDALRALHLAYGLSVTSQATFAIDATGVSGAAATWMQTLRARKPLTVGEARVVQIDDGLLPDGSTAFAQLPKSDALAFWLEAATSVATQSGGRHPGPARTRVLIRPSGTEPKLKAYFEIVEAAPAQSQWAARRHACQMELNALRSAFAALVQQAAPVRP